MASAESVPDESDLVIELGELAQRGIKRTFQYAYGKRGMHPLELPQLFKIVEELYPELWAGTTEERVKAIRSAIERAVASLPERTVRTTQANYRETACFVYELMELEPAAYRKIQEQQGHREYDRRVAFLSQAWGFGKGTVGRGILEVRTALAAVLVTLVADESETDTSQAESLAGSLLPGNSGYIPRDAIHREFANLVQSGARCIVLVGQAGMGKSWLAAALLGNSAPTIRIEAGVPRLEDVQTPFAAAGLSKDSVLGENPAAYLAALLSSSNAPEWIVLDNLNTTAELRRLLPSSCRSRILVTCRTRSSDGPTDFRCISVGAMETDEAQALVARQRPEFSASDARHLATALHGHPLILQHACTLFGYTRSSVEDFCAEIERGIVQMFNQAMTSDESTLWIVLQRLVNYITSKDVLAGYLLACITFTPLARRLDHAELLEFCATCILAGKQEGSVKVATAQAIQTLNENHLIEYLPSREITMHALTRNVLIMAFTPKLPYIGGKLAKGVAQVLLQRTNATETTPAERAAYDAVPILIAYLMVLQAYPEKPSGVSEEERKLVEEFVSDIVGSTRLMPVDPIEILPSEYMEWVEANLPPPSDEFMANMKDWATTYNGRKSSSQIDHPGTSSG